MADVSREDPLLTFDPADLPHEMWHAAALSIGCIIILLLASILFFRRNRLVGERRRQRIIREWTPLLEQSVCGALPTLPSLSRRDHVVFLYLWNESYESRGETMTAPLVRVARAVGSHHLAAELLQSRLLSQRILGVATLGRLQERSAWEHISPLLTQHNSFLAFQAAQALLRINARDALPLLVPILGRRKDWSPLKIVSMLNSIGRDVASEVLAKAATHGDPDVGPRLIRYLPATQRAHGLPILRQFLSDHSPSANLLAACLFVFGDFRDPADRPLVRRHLTHPAWYVRVQAATALGKLGTADDEERLIALFDDEQWWVRYRAGEALASLDSMTEDKLMTLQESLATPEAQEILAPVLAKYRARRSPIAVRP